MQSVAIRNSGETRKHPFLLLSFIYRAHENGFVYLIWEIKFFNEYFFFQILNEHIFQISIVITYLSCTIILLDVRERFHNVIIGNHQNCSNFTIKLLTAFR